MLLLRDAAKAVADRILELDIAHRCTRYPDVSRGSELEGLGPIPSLHSAGLPPTNGR